MRSKLAYDYSLRSKHKSLQELASQTVLGVCSMKFKGEIGIPTPIVACLWVYQRSATIMNKPGVGVPISTSRNGNQCKEALRAAAAMLF